MLKSYFLTLSLHRNKAFYSKKISNLKYIIKNRIFTANLDTIDLQKRCIINTINPHSFCVSKKRTHSGTLMVLAWVYPHCFLTSIGSLCSSSQSRTSYARESVVGPAATMSLSKLNSKSSGWDNTTFRSTRQRRRPAAAWRSSRRGSRMRFSQRRARACGGAETLFSAILYVLKTDY